MTAVVTKSPADMAREGFGWRVVTDPEFWRCWHSDKATMKAEGYRVIKGDAGQWLVSFDPQDVATAMTMLRWWPT